MAAHPPTGPDLVALGFALVPVQPRAKDPVYLRDELEHGVKDASADPDTVRRWAERFPSANWSIATEPSGLAVLDVDERAGGADTLRDLEAELGPLPPTWTTLTGGGEHRYFRAPAGVRIASRAGALGPGLDVKAAGGLVVAPGSTHPSGRRYQWEIGAAPGDLPLAELPAALVARLARPNISRQPGAPALDADARIPEGERNDTLARWGVRLRRAGLAAEEIAAALAVMNARRCDPPLPEAEVARIAQGMERYDAGAGPAGEGGQILATATPDADDRAEARRRFLEAKAQRRLARYRDCLRELRTLRAIVRDRGLSDGDKIFAIHMMDITAQWAKRPTPTGEYRLAVRTAAAALGIARSTLSARVDALAAKTGAYTVRDTRTKKAVVNPLTQAAVIDPTTGRPVVDHRTDVFITPRASGLAFGRAVACRTFQPGAPRARRIGAPRGRSCTSHPDAPLVMTTRTTWRCSACTAVVDERARTREVAPPTAAPTGTTTSTRPKFGHPAPAVAARGWSESHPHIRRDRGVNPPTPEPGQNLATPPPSPPTATRARWDTFITEAGRPTLRMVPGGAAAVPEAPRPRPPQEWLDDLAAVGGDG